MSGLAVSETRRSRRALGGGGRQIGSVPARSDAPGELAVAATLRQAALRRARLGIRDSEPVVKTEDFREALRREESGTLIVIVVDCSDSMGITMRISAAKGAALSLLRHAGVTKNRVSVVGFGGEGAQVVVSPTASVARARQALDGLRVGGATPLAAGLSASLAVLEAETRLHPRYRRRTIVLTDGEANVPQVPGGNIEQEILSVGQELGRRADEVTILHTGPKGRTLMERLSTACGGVYHHAEEFGGRQVIELGVYST